MSRRRLKVDNSISGSCEKRHAITWPGRSPSSLSLARHANFSSSAASSQLALHSSERSGVLAFGVVNILFSCTDSSRMGGRQSVGGPRLPSYGLCLSCMSSSRTQLVNQLANS